MSAVGLHFTKQIVDGLRFGHKANGADQLLHQTVLALGLIQLEHIADMHETDDVVDGLLVHGDAGELLVDDELAQIVERFTGFDRDDFGSRRHDLADGLVTERHD